MVDKVYSLKGLIGLTKVISFTGFIWLTKAISSTAFKELIALLNFFSKLEAQI